MKKIQNGFTIVELMIYMALLSVFILVLLDIFVTTLNFKLQSESTSALNQDARAILANLNYNVYNAGAATVASSTQLSLDSGAKVYQLSSGDLLLNSVKLNSANTKVDSISFTKVGTTIRVSYTLESLIETQGVAKNQSIDATLGLRY
ncbi:MAG TPA: prepilin-type N-terminal cleavage/methylation domain-containing protein [Patescibacteria group bacterium]|nr:prepilin-type N-terminal cleavage/methylation domain-containing protein [Patescibacteria group bacterium]